MNCPNCDTSNPEDGRFCISCGVPLPTASATGPTRRLDESITPVLVAPEMEPAASSPGTLQGARLAQMMGAIWLIGLGILFLTRFFWPGILVLVGITSFIQLSARGRQQDGLTSLVFFIGICFLFLSKMFWPGILILMGIVALLSQWSRFRS